MPNITSFSIVGLHGHRTVRLEFADNRLVLVGENGSGKTTIINALFFFLSRQWSRLASIDFTRISAEIDGTILTVDHEQLEHDSMLDRWRSLLGPKQLDRLREAVRTDGDRDIWRDRMRISELGVQFGLPPTETREIVRRLLDDPSLFSAGVESADAWLRRFFVDQILYLPTYRRIEHELHAILPEGQAEKVREVLNRRQPRQGFIEFVEFGMEDVQQDIDRRLRELRDSLAIGFRNLATEYVRDVLTRREDSDFLVGLQEVDPIQVERIFQRVDEKTLAAPVRERLRELLQRLGDKQAITRDDWVLALFLTRLLELQIRQELEEKAVHDFVHYCNSYLVGKEVRFDSLENTVAVYLKAGAGNIAPDTKPLLLKSLSSGEKQIVSLFSHLCLSRTNQMFMLIDEPELSLSVRWQKTLLPHVLETGRCTGLVAVTHSPFVFENGLDRYAHGINEFTKP